MDAGQETGAAFLDLSKAFHPVDHDLLLNKLVYVVSYLNIIEWLNSNIQKMNIKKSNFLLVRSSRRLKSCGQIKLVVQDN